MSFLMINSETASAYRLVTGKNSVKVLFIFGNTGIWKSGTICRIFDHSVCQNKNGTHILSI